MFENHFLQNTGLIITLSIILSCILGFGTAGYERKN